MDYIDIKVRFRAHDPMLFAELVSMNKRHRADFVRICAMIGHAAMRGISANVPEMSRHLDNRPSHSPPLNKTQTRNKNDSLEGGEDGLHLTDEEYAEIGEGIEMLLNSNSMGR